MHDVDQPVRVGEGRGPQDGLVHHAEYGCGGADPECESAEDQQCVSGTRSQAPDRDFDVMENWHGR